MEPWRRHRLHGLKGRIRRQASCAVDWKAIIAYGVRIPAFDAGSARNPSARWLRLPERGRGDDLLQAPEMRAGPVDPIARTAGPELVVVTQRVGREPP
jgi:hypothetical protein